MRPSDWIVLAGMVTALVVVLPLLAVTAGAALLDRWAWRRLTARRALVSLHSGAAVDGVLVERRGGLLVLAEARVVEPGRGPVPADGRVVVERSQVAWLQVDV